MSVRKNLGLLQVLVLHAVDRTCSTQWDPRENASGPSQCQGLVSRVLPLLQPLALSILKTEAMAAPRCHSRSTSLRDPASSVEIEGPLAKTGEESLETAGPIGFATRRLVEALDNDQTSVEVSGSGPSTGRFRGLESHERESGSAKLEFKPTCVCCCCGCVCFRSFNASREPPCSICCFAAVQWVQEPRLHLSK